MHAELVHQVDQLAQIAQQARTGDIASLAEVLDQCETLRDVGVIHDVPGIAPTAEALGEFIKRMIMSDGPDADGDLETLRSALTTLQSGVVGGAVPGPEAFGDAIAVAPWNGADTGEAPAEPASASGTALEGPEAPESGASEGEAATAAPEAPAAPETGGPETEPLPEEPETPTLEAEAAMAELEAAQAQPEAEAAADEDAALQADLVLEPAVEPEAGGEEGAFAADAELLGEYLAEQRGRLEEIEGYLLALEREQDDAALADLRRALHTIKGDSGFLGLAEVARISHAAETYLETAGYPYDLEVLFAMKDWLARAFGDLAAGGQLGPGTRASLNQIVGQLDRDAEASSPEREAPDPAPAGDEDYDPSVANHELLAELAAEAPAEAPVDETLDMPAELATGDQEPAERPAFFQLSAEESLLVDFIQESKEHLDQASSQLLVLEGDPENEEAINSVFRAFHTVKGIAGFLNLQEISELAHDTENLLDRVRRNELELTPALTDLVFEALDWMTRLIGNVRKGLESNGQVMTEPELEPFLERIGAAQKGVMPVSKPGERTERLGEILTSSGAVERPVVEETVRELQQVPTGQRLGEALVEKQAVTPSQVHEALRQQVKQQQAVQKQPEAGPRRAVELKETLRVDYERLESMINTIGELVLAEAMISQDDNLVSVHSEALDKKLYNLRQVSRKLQELGTTIRMVPISGTFQKMARLVRDLSRKSGKPISFFSYGDETELDRAYVDLIADPLVHMIRNAVDHGIELPGDRRKSGKAESGRIELRAFHEGGNIHMEVRDDGQGLDPERIFRKGVERGLVSDEDRDKMSEQEILHLIFLPGFSTASQVTEVSGRGVGMDVVRRNIAELRGQVQIQSEIGKGTTFKIILPLTLALIDGMLVQVGAERYIFPVLSVVESARPSADMIHKVVGKGEMISLRGRQLPLYRLHRLFGIPDAKSDVEDSLVVVVENDGRQAGILVDDLVGIQQTVIKNLGSGVFEARGLSGGSIMADGTVGLIVDVPGLMSIARSTETGLASDTFN